MMDHGWLWLKFLAAAAVVVLAGLRLTRNAEKLAAALGWGHAFAGFVILGWATSLPELTISISAVTALGSAPLSAGNISGSVIFNLGILAALDWVVARRRIKDGEHIPGLMPLGTFNVVMLSALLLLAWAPSAIDSLPWAGGVFMLLVYVAATAHGWWTDRQDTSTGDGHVIPHPADLAPETAKIEGGVGKAGPLIVRCLVDGAVILVMGVWLTHLGDGIATAYQLTEGFVGTLFLATVSSLPELVTGLAAIRLGLHIMAAGSILGSNIFNLAIIGTCDLLWQLGDGGGHLMQAAVSAEPGRLPRNVAIALAMTVSAIVAKRLQRADPEGRPKRLLAVISLALYLTAVVWV